MEQGEMAACLKQAELWLMGWMEENSTQQPKEAQS